MKPLSERLLAEAQHCEPYPATEMPSTLIVGAGSSTISSLLREAAALARKVESAARGEVWQHALLDGQRQTHVILTREADDGLAPIGKRVALVEVG